MNLAGVLLFIQAAAVSQPCSTEPLADEVAKQREKPQQDKAQVWQGAPWKWPFRPQEGSVEHGCETAVLPELTFD